VVMNSSKSGRGFRIAEGGREKNEKRRAEALLGHAPADILPRRTANVLPRATG